MSLTACLIALAFVPATSLTLMAETPIDADSIEFFEKKIRPVLANKCFNCHSANTNSQGGLRLDDRNGQLTGGGSGPASLILQVIEHADGVTKMPPKKKLTDDEIADLKKWVNDGAAWPKPVAPTDINRYDKDYETLRKEHWAWQPIKQATPPDVQDKQWATGEIDRFIQSEIESTGLTRTSQANREVLARRLSYDLTGLPPSSESVDAFVSNTAEDALDQYIEKLLSSSAFGERWGHHWLESIAEVLFTPAPQLDCMLKQPAHLPPTPEEQNLRNTKTPTIPNF